jgi:membrane fusion protein (multidrug efflux system)
MYRTPVLLTVLAAAACNEAGAQHATTKPAPAPIAVERITVGEAPMPDILTLTGKLTADQRAEVTADTQGKVLDVFVKRGQRVTKGQPLLQLDVRSAALQTREATANLDAARAEQALAQVECARGETLFAKGAITKSEADKIATRCSSAASQVSAASARAQVISKSVKDGIVRAPFDGVIAAKNVTAGEWVAPGRALLTLVDADPLLVELTVPESSIHAIELDQAVRLRTISRPGTTYDARVTRLGAEVGTSRALVVEATVAAPGELVPGLFTEAEVIVGFTPRAVIPPSAALRRDGGWHVFVIKGEGNTELEERVIDIAPVWRTDQLAVLANLAKGEVIVNNPTEATVDGLLVQ